MLKIVFNIYKEVFNICKEVFNTCKEVTIVNSLNIIFLLLMKILLTVMLHYVKLFLKLAFNLIVCIIHAICQHCPSRVSSTDDYFLSELTYSPSDCLYNAKQLSLHVLTLGDESIDDSYSLLVTGTGDKTIIDGKSENCLQHNCQFDSCSSEGVLIPVVGGDFAVDSDLRVGILETNGCALNLQKRLATESDRCDHGDNHSLISNIHSLFPPPKLARIDKSRSHPAFKKTADVEAIRCKLNELFESRRDGGAGFILDIDLDFFSTADPFRSQLTKRQYDLLKALYSYMPPEDRSHKVSVCWGLMSCFI